ncbi:hypothetical protein FHG87_016439 [Trinorchestia longiramus]|nr:hypothetical protein FHG87_016439 [Trinorchestia longiramus]
MRDHPFEEEEEVVEVDLTVNRTEASMLKEFMKLQEQRCVAYNTLERCMREFRAKKQLCAFQGTMREITDTFQTVSLAIIQLAKDLGEAGHNQSAMFIDQLQDYEQAKLRLTAEMHIKLQAVSNNANEEDQAELRRLRSDQVRFIGRINDILDALRYRAHPEEA